MLFVFGCLLGRSGGRGPVGGSLFGFGSRGPATLVGGRAGALLFVCLRVVVVGPGFVAVLRWPRWLVWRLRALFLLGVRVLTPRCHTAGTGSSNDGSAGATAAVPIDLNMQSLEAFRQMMLTLGPLMQPLANAMNQAPATNPVQALPAGVLGRASLLYVSIHVF